MSVYKNALVERILKEDVLSRSDDKWLMIRVWALYDLIFSEAQTKLFLSNRIPSPETIRRTRQKLQQDGKYLANLTTMNQRKNQAEITKQELGQIKMFDEEIGRKIRRWI